MVLEVVCGRKRGNEERLEKTQWSSPSIVACKTRLRVTMQLPGASRARELMSHPEIFLTRVSAW
ncbi:hypothetical protein [Variovorax sp. PAMC26660]|uniref:hypothetical protein n=1 Tax=Variovorax sp. PAMC26660 TaxID=2762322 RepID=UPI00164E91A6|nr:hypothetical protein [Variovorax sp. PAMC26660]QNK68618.1 hypothetical protein H7F35_02415 [Variovorax sp. PAMC26660]